MIGEAKDLQTTNESVWSKSVLFNKQEYDYKKNLEHLRERYINKIHWYMEHANTENKKTYKGCIDGLSTVIHDIEDMLDGLDV
jgi:hypothetical protein